MSTVGTSVGPQRQDMTCGHALPSSDSPPSHGLNDSSHGEMTKKSREQGMDGELGRPEGNFGAGPFTEVESGGSLKRDNGQGYSTEGILLPKLRFSRNCRGCREADLHHMPRS